MKQILMTAEVEGQPKYSISVICHNALLQHAHPEHVAQQWVFEFIHNLYISKGFWGSKVTFTMTTHEGSRLYRFVQYFNPKSEEDLAEFWIPVVTKYISEN